MKRILTIVGARPQFIKAAPVSLALQEAGFECLSVHTGQHYDENMSAVFYDQLNMTKPTHQLAIGSGSHGWQTGEGLKAIEEILISEKPDAVLVYGDTNATIAGALAAVKLHIPVAHVEAGLRSFNRRMPEEINRVVTDHVSTWLYTPTQTATDHLANEGMSQGVLWVGDVMLDAVDQFGPLAEQQCAGLLDELELGAKQYWLMTMHRAESTDQPEQVKTILTTLDSLGTPILFPVHPRIKAMVESFGPYRHIRLTDPMGYFEMLMAERHASLIVTDSGGVQKEAVFANVPCVTMRTETEWTETVQAGWNQIVGLDANKLVAAIEQADSLAKEPIRHHYGNGAASQTIARHLSEALDHAAQQKPATETGVTVPV